MRPYFRLVVLFLVGCQSTWGTLLVRIELPSDVVTQCVSITAGLGRPRVTVARNGKSVLLVGVSETADLSGTVTFSVLRYAREDCSVPVGTSQQKTVTLAHDRNETLTFAFDDDGGPELDGGADGGPDGGPSGDGGVDGGCELARCVAPPECSAAAVSCLGDGGCVYPPAARGTACDGGLCDGARLCRPPCLVLSDGALCDDGLSCTSDHCAGGSCVGACLNAPPPCQRVMPVCAEAAACQLESLPDNTLCDRGDLDGGRQACRTGQCEQALPFAPRNLDDLLTAYPAPSGPWHLVRGCITVIDTGLSPPAPLDGGWCSASGPSAAARPLARDGGEAAIFSMSGLDIPEGTAVHFVGGRPVVMVIVGDATIAGVVSVAPTMGLAPAGSDPAECASPNAHLDGHSPWGGGGAGYGASAGAGGSTMDAGGLGGASWGDGSLEPLRGGCRGGNGSGPQTGGLGGGALQLSVGGQLLIADSGVVTASGGGGRGGPLVCGGGGGGSGGAILLEADVLFQWGFVTTNGGGGSEGSDFDGGAPGDDGAMASALPAAGGASDAGGTGGPGGAGASLGGAAGHSTSLSGGGGGGAVGRIRFKVTNSTVSKTTTERVSGQLRSF